MGRLYENILETIGNTPVVKIGALAPEGINLYVKIEAFNPLGSVKDRLALAVIEAGDISSPEDAGALANSDWRKGFAASVASAIEIYLARTTVASAVP